MGLGDFLEDLSDLITGEGARYEAEQKERDRREEEEKHPMRAFYRRMGYTDSQIEEEEKKTAAEEQRRRAALRSFKKQYSELKRSFASEFENYQRTKSQASQSRMNAINQSMVDFHHDHFGAKYREAREQVQKDLNYAKAEVLEKIEAENGKKSDLAKLYDKSSSRMRLRPYTGKTLELSGVVDKIEFANHEGQMQAVIKKVEVDTEKGPIRYDHLNFFVSESVGDEMLQNIGERLQFKGKVNLYDRGESSTKKGSSEKSYGFTDVEVVTPEEVSEQEVNEIPVQSSDAVQSGSGSDVAEQESGQETLPFPIGQTVRFSALVNRVDVDGRTVELSKVEFEGNADRVNELVVRMKSSASVTTIGIFSNGNAQAKMKLAAICHDRVQFQGVVADDNGKKAIHDTIAQFS
jgi:hypothetical protein